MPHSPLDRSIPFRWLMAAALLLIASPWSGASTVQPILEARGAGDPPPPRVTDRDLRRWRARLELGGRLELEDLAAMAQLPEALLRRVEETGLPTRAAREHRELLRVYAALDEEQRAQMEGPGLRVRELDSIQLEWLTQWKPSHAAGADGRLRLRRLPAAVVFSLETDAPAPREERIWLGRRGPKALV